MVTSTYAIGITLNETWYALTTVGTICVMTLSVVNNGTDCVILNTFINVYTIKLLNVAY